MAKLVVDPLETVHVDEGDDEGVPRPGAAGHLPLQGDEAGAALQHAGQFVSLEDLALLVGIATLVLGHLSVRRRLHPVHGGGGTIERRLLALGGRLVSELCQRSPIPEVDDPVGDLSFGGVRLAVALVGLPVARISLAVSFVGLSVARARSLIGR